MKINYDLNLTLDDLLQCLSDVIDYEFNTSLAKLAAITALVYESTNINNHKRVVV